MTTIGHKTFAELDAFLDQVRGSPRDAGTVELIVRRPQTGDREVLTLAGLDVTEGLVGDNWQSRGSRHTEDGSAHPEMQLNIANAWAVSAVAGESERWPLAGDQFYVDFDISESNLPPGTRLALGEAEIEVTAIPHLGCQKFAQHFGRDALRWVNSELGRSLHLRGINARVISGGAVRAGDAIRKLPAMER